MGLHTKARITGEVQIRDKELTTLSTGRMNKIRGGDMSMIFQDPMTALNPLMKIKQQITETLKLHGKKSKNERESYAVELLDKAGIPRPQRLAEAFPHELSAGMRRCVVGSIAMANRL